MKTTILTLALLLTAATTFSQMLDTIVYNDVMKDYTPKKKSTLFSGNDIAVYSLTFISGAAGGFNDALWAHNPYKGNQFFDPYISWENKYTSKLPFAKNVLVCTTDAQHASRFISDISMIVAVGLSFNDIRALGKKQTRGTVLKKIGICWAANRAGHMLVYDVIY